MKTLRNILAFPFMVNAMVSAAIAYLLVLDQEDMKTIHDLNEEYY